MSRRILVVAHNHPSLHPGGTEIFAHDLFSAYRRQRGVEAMFLAATNQVHRARRPGTAFQAVGSTPDEIVLWSGHFDRFYLSQVDTHGVVPDLVGLLEEFRPQVVHMHHLLLIGAEFIALVRRVLPKTRIVMTLHDYYPICAHDGLMVRTKGRERCEAASPHRCSGCFPEIAADRFLLREQHLKTLFREIDAFVAPSWFLKERYVRWGLPPAPIEVIQNGLPHGPVAPHRPSPDGRRPVFGYFGNLNPWKGITVLLKAAQRLGGGDLEGFSVRLHGGAPFQAERFVAEVERLVAEREREVVPLGPYRREDLPELMAAVDWVVVPSIWWENAPLVIQEAFRHRRPVIASGIGGMAEAVRDGIDGLYARPDDPHDLAAVMRRAADEPGLWDRLIENITPPPSIDEVAERHLELFERLRGIAKAA